MREPIPRSTFDRWRAQGAGWSPLFSEPMMRLALEHLESALGPGRTVLDLGAATGHVSAVFHARGARAVALDVDAEVLARGRAPYPGPERLVADQARLPLRGASVDALFAFSSIHYSSDRAAVLAECRRVLKPGGRIAVVENLAGNPFARFGRWLRAASRAPYPEHLRPRAHLRWGQRAIYERHFREVAFDAFHLLTPMLLASGAMAQAPASGDAPRGAYGLLHGLDGRLLRWWPGAAWCVVVRAVR